MRLSDAMMQLIIEKIPVGPADFVVLVEVGGRKDIASSEYNWNIYRINNSGQIIWKVSGAASKHPRDSFVSVYREGNILKADRFFGGEYVIDATDGRIEEAGWHK